MDPNIDDTKSPYTSSLEITQLKRWISSQSEPPCFGSSIFFWGKQGVYAWALPNLSNSDTKGAFTSQVSLMSLLHDPDKPPLACCYCPKGACSFCRNIINALCVSPWEKLTTHHPISIPTTSRCQKKMLCKPDALACIEADVLPRRLHCRHQQMVSLAVWVGALGFNPGYPTRRSQESKPPGPTPPITPQIYNMDTKEFPCLGRELPFPKTIIGYPC